MSPEKSIQRNNFSSYSEVIESSVLKNVEGPEIKVTENPGVLIF